jgi:hypothetical protein
VLGYGINALFFEVNTDKRYVTEQARLRHRGLPE